MATKWKSKSSVWIWALLFTFGLCGIFLLLTQGHYYTQKDYFHTREFEHRINEFAGNLLHVELANISFDEAKDLITVTDEEIDEHRYRHGDLFEQISIIRDQYETLINRAWETDNEQIVAGYENERDEKIADITKNFESDQHVAAKIVQEKEQELVAYYQELATFHSRFLAEKEAFSYHFTSDSGDIFTNFNQSESETLKDKLNPDKMLYIKDYDQLSDFEYNYPHSSDLLENIAINTRFSGEIGVPKTLGSSNRHMINYQNYQRGQTFFWLVVAVCMLSFLLSFSFAKKEIKKKRKDSKWNCYYNKMPIDLSVCLFCLTGIFASFTMFLIVSDIYVFDQYYLNNWPILAIGLIISSLFWGVTFIQGRLLVESVGDWQELINKGKQSLLSKIIKRIKVLLEKVVDYLKEAFLDRSTATQFFLVLATVFGLGVSLVFVFMHPIFFLLFVALFGGIGVPLAGVLVKRIGYFNRIVEKTNELAAGELGEDLSVPGQSVLATLASNINLLKDGVQHSQSEQAKSERLKTELITNVSHDLRTPLTSIITYTELLKTTDVSEADNKAYLEIIDRKAQRLKGLIDDLFEVSKMASGNIALNKEKADLVQLLQQALAEHDDAINASNLQFRVTNSDKVVYARVDGQKLWRVFDNLIANILNYSLEYSRVYINLSTTSDQAVMTFKNVSKYELSENSEELAERFKRGDTSRHTEGSGLGLAIAESIVDLHQGRLEVETDGDLFKVTIYLRLEG